MPRERSPKTIILMGVSGSGKSTVGRYVADAIDARFVEGDDYHPSNNIVKMSAGISLDDGDREPWIEALIETLNRQSEQKVVLSCSALTKNIRDRLRQEIAGSVLFICLSASFETLAARLSQRQDHFMPPALLQSQLDTLEMPEDAVNIDVTPSLEDVCAQALRAVRQCGAQ